MGASEEGLVSSAVVSLRPEMVGWWPFGGCSPRDLGLGTWDTSQRSRSPEVCGSSGP